jgi:hypothetical protein
MILDLRPFAGQVHLDPVPLGLVTSGKGCILVVDAVVGWVLSGT